MVCAIVSSIADPLENVTTALFRATTFDCSSVLLVHFHKLGLGNMLGSCLDVTGWVFLLGTVSHLTSARMFGLQSAMLLLGVLTMWLSNVSFIIASSAILNLPCDAVDS